MDRQEEPKVGDRVSINLIHRFGDSHSTITKLHQSASGGILYILANGQWLTINEFTLERV